MDGNLIADMLPRTITLNPLGNGALLRTTITLAKYMMDFLSKSTRREISNAKFLGAPESG
jgi:hypothetical protein